MTFFLRKPGAWLACKPLAGVLNGGLKLCSSNKLSVDVYAGPLSVDQNSRIINFLLQAYSLSSFKSLLK